MFHSSPSGGSESMQLMYLIAITAAVRTIDIASACFVPDAMARLALFDPRSFHLNDEANLNIYDAGFTARLTQVFEADLQRCRRVSLQDWERRPALEKARERVTALLAPVL